MKRLALLLLLLTPSVHGDYAQVEEGQDMVTVSLAPQATSAEADCGVVEENEPFGSEEIQPEGAVTCASASAEGWIIGVAVGGGVGAVLASTWAWLGWLRWLPAMGLFTRLRSDKLLDHPIRARVHGLIAAEPGIHFHAIMERTGKSRGHVSHHLAVLVRAELLSVIRSRGFSTYFVKGALDAPVMRGLSAVKSTTGIQALRAIAAEPGQARRAVARQVGCNESTLRYHTARFRRAGLLGKDRDLRVTPLGIEVLQMLPDEHAAPKRPPGPVPI